MIYELVNDCIESETERGIEKTMLKELRRYLHEFAGYCQQNPITPAKGAATQFGKKAKQEGLCHSRSYLQHRYAAVFSCGTKKGPFFCIRQLYL